MPVNVTLHHVTEKIGIRMIENVVEAFARRVIPVTFVAVRDADQNDRLDLPVARQFIRNPVQTPTAVAEASVRVVPDVLSVLTVDDRESPPVIALGFFRQVDIDRSRGDSPKAR